MSFTWGPKMQDLGVHADTLHPDSSYTLLCRPGCPAEITTLFEGVKFLFLCPWPTPSERFCALSLNGAHSCAPSHPLSMNLCSLLVSVFTLSPLVSSQLHHEAASGVHATSHTAPACLSALPMSLHRKASIIMVTKPKNSETTRI